jgi:hypothetical protein
MLVSSVKICKRMTDQHAKLASQDPTLNFRNEYLALYKIFLDQPILNNAEIRVVQEIHGLADPNKIRAFCKPLIFKASIKLR